MYFFYLIYLHPEDSEHKILGMIKITLPDGSVKEFAKGTTPMDVAKSISEGLARNVISAAFNGTTVETETQITTDGSLILYTWNDKEGKKAFWHSTSHVMAQVLEEQFTGIKLTLGPAIDNGFYINFVYGFSISLVLNYIGFTQFLSEPISNLPLYLTSVLIAGLTFGGQFNTAKRYKENWFTWQVYNVIKFAQNLQMGNIAQLLKYTFYFFNALLGWITWTYIKMLKNKELNTEVS